MSQNPRLTVHSSINISTSSQNGKVSQSTKDFKRKSVTSLSPLGKKSIINYDKAMKLPLSVKSYGLYKTRYKYNAEGKLIKERQGRRVSTYSYDDKGNLASTTNPLKKTTIYLYDSRNRLIQSTYADSTSEYFDYDANGNQIKRTVPTPAEHSFAYNGVNKRTNYTSPEAKETTYTYDKQRRVTQIKKPSGKTIDTIYTKGRVTSIQTEETSTNYTYSCQSKLENITKGDENLDFSYDGSLLTSLSQEGIVNQDISYTYNNDFNPISMTYANQTETYTYNDDNELLTIGDYTIKRQRRNRRLTLSDGSYSKKIKINGYGEIKESKDNNFKIKLKRNKAGKIVKKEERLKGKRKVKYKYTYDERDRLIKVKKNRKTVERYSYDKNGNRKMATINGKNITASYTLDDNLVVYGDNTYRYDEDGYLSEKTTPQGTTTYSYGTLGELLSVNTPTQSISYTHNANNQRVAKLIEGEITEKYLWANLTTLLAIYNPDDSLKQRFEYANQRMPISMTMGNQKYYLHYDQVGSLRAISDSSHTIIKEITYDSFGNILSDSNEAFTIPFGFAGGLYDIDTKLTRFGYRDYDAYVGKWTAKDPIGFLGGDSNLYGYVLGDGVNFIDPSGLIPPLAVAIAGAVTGGGMSFYDGNTGGVKIPERSELLINICIGGLGGLGAGVGFVSKVAGSTARGVIGDIFINVSNYANSN